MSSKPSNSSPDNMAIRAKVDNGKPSGGEFPPGSQDRIYQIVALPPGYTTIRFEGDEIQHELGEYTKTIYGRVDGGPWVQLWQIGLEAPYATSKFDWYRFSHDIVAPGYDEAMVEFWLQPHPTNSGVKLTNLDLRVLFE